MCELLGPTDRIDKYQRPAGPMDIQEKVKEGNFLFIGATHLLQLQGRGQFQRRICGARHSACGSCIGSLRKIENGGLWPGPSMDINPSAPAKMQRTSPAPAGRTFASIPIPMRGMCCKIDNFSPKMSAAFCSSLCAAAYVQKCPGLIRSFFQ